MNPDDTTDVTISYTTDEGDPVELTETVTFRGLAEILSALERNATGE
ncbi:hypothetical protein AB0E81_11085 [Streptomyces sp. NPDC033538]